MTQTNTNKAAILAALRAWIAQRPGFDSRNYEASGYRADCRTVARQRRDALAMLRFVELSGSITGEMLADSFRHSFSGRLSWNGVRLDYCIGQYWPTEYRAAAASVLAGAIWAWLRDECCPKDEEYKGDWIRSAARRNFGRAIASRWFN